MVTVDNYEELASTTCKDLGSLEANNTHMQMGIYTESAELIDVLKKQLAYGKDIDWVNVKEEIGDAFWYLANFCKFNGMSFSEEVDSTNYWITGFTKEKAMYDELKFIMTCTTNISENFDIILGNYMSIIASYTDFTLDEILQVNIDKLAARYPEGFSSYYALNRNLEKERTILES
jgi:hypothetical protein